MLLSLKIYELARIAVQIQKKFPQTLLCRLDVMSLFLFSFQIEDEKHRSMNRLQFSIGLVKPSFQLVHFALIPSYSVMNSVSACQSL